MSCLTLFFIRNLFIRNLTFAKKNHLLLFIIISVYKIHRPISRPPRIAHLFFEVDVGWASPVVEFDGIVLQMCIEVVLERVDIISWNDLLWELVPYSGDALHNLGRPLALRSPNY